MLASYGNTPWGNADGYEKVADGIEWFFTPSHGGILLSPERHAAMPAKWRKTFAGGRWYEEDCDAAKVVVTFPEHFTPQTVNAAMRQIEAMPEYY